MPFIGHRYSARLGNNALSYGKKANGSKQRLEERFLQGEEIKELIGNSNVASLETSSERLSDEVIRWLIEHGVNVPYMHESDELRKRITGIFSTPLLQPIIFDKTLFLKKPTIKR